MASHSAIDIGITSAQREEIAAALSRLLADTYVLYGKTHGFHWNVTGPMFNTLHLMFKGQYTELWNALDVIAERIRALGVLAPHGGSTLAGLASIQEAEQQPAALDMVHELVTGHEAVARTARSIFPLAEAANDEPTADLLTQRLQIHEKTAWMLRSLLDNSPSLQAGADSKLKGDRPIGKPQQFSAHRSDIFGLSHRFSVHRLRWPAVARTAAHSSCHIRIHPTRTNRRDPNSGSPTLVAHGLAQTKQSKFAGAIGSQATFAALPAHRNQNLNATLSMGCQLRPGGTS